MNEILQANIFFLIASIATICFCVLISIILYQLIKIMQVIRAILTRVEEGSEVIAEDLTNLRSAIMDGGIVSRLIGLFFGGRSPSKPKQRKNKITNRSKNIYGNEESSEKDWSN